MRFSLLLVVLAALSPILAAPVKDKNPAPEKPGKVAPGGDRVAGRKPGTHFSEKTHEVPDAHPGDIVLATPKDFMGADKGKGSSKNKVHPAIVVAHDPNTHIVHVAPIGHAHPGGVPTMPGSALGLPETPDKTAAPSLVGLGPPKAIKHENLMKVPELPEGSTKAPLPPSLTPEHLEHLRQQLAAANPPPPEPASEGKGKKKASGKEKRELDFDLEERYFLESMFDDEW